MPMTKEQKALYTAMGFTNQTVIRKPGQIDGCKDCVIRIFDHCAQVTIDASKFASCLCFFLA